MATHVNLSSYDDVESMDNFTGNEFERYCREKLDSCDKHIAFIQKHLSLVANRKCKVVEIGSGNSRLLYRLEEEQILSEGFGIEVSASRHEFAEKFKKLVNAKLVTNVNDNIFAISPFKAVDLLIGVDIVWQLITPLHEEAEKELLQWIRASLASGGYLLLELWDLSDVLKQVELANGIYRYWKPLSAPDPFEFALAEVVLNGQGDLDWRKTFLKRGSNQRSHFRNVIRHYSVRHISEKLKNAGFEIITTQPFWQEAGDTNDPGEFVVLAQKM